MTIAGKHTSIGATKEKTKGLEQLKEKRRAKQDNVSRKARTSFEESPVKRRSSTPSSESSDEEGQFRPGDDSLDSSTPVPKKEEKEEPATLQDFHKARLTREQLAKFCHVTWFQELVQGEFTKWVWCVGAYVRYLIGNDEAGPIYRLCEIVDLGPDLVKPYNIESQVTNQVLELRHGKDTRHFPMDKVSNGLLTEREVERYLRICQSENVKLPTKSRLEKKAQALHKLTSQHFTDSDITKIMERKMALQQRPSHAQVLQEKSRLNQARNLARSRRDTAEVAELDAKIAELEAQSDTRAPVEDQWAKVNERNRRLNLEQTKKAEALAMARRKALIASRSNTPKSGTPKPETPANLAPPPDVVPVATPSTTYDAMMQAVSIDIDF
ncbi:hypothetical protein FRC12_013110 [Ceratobasidium sp. 428]|nr:hypothetical protein FRC12_013110 [Ceratobasidium sp. 428]